MKALVLGGAGYIGSHMVRTLQRSGHDVAVFDSFITGHRKAVQGVHVYEGDLLKPDNIDAALQDFQPELVLHFAARSLVSESMVEPALYYANNVVGTHNLLESLRRNGVHRLVFSSTAATYGTPQQDLIDESHPQAPINTYGWSKLFAERMIADACRSYGLRAVALRYFNAAGADPDGDIGESHTPETHLIPNVLKVAAGEGSEVRLNGSDFPTPDGYCVRDYVHVNDLCDAHLRAAQSMERAGLPAFQVFNLGCGSGFSVLEVLRATERVIGRKLPSTVAPARPGDPATLVASSAKAQEILGWKPAYTDIEDIIATAWRWHQAPRY